MGYSMLCTAVVINSITQKDLQKTRVLTVRQYLADIELKTMNLTEYLLILDVSNCLITKIGTGEHQGLNNLVKHNISHNLFNALSEGSFSGLTNLEYLDIS